MYSLEQTNFFLDIFVKSSASGCCLAFAYFFAGFSLVMLMKVLLKYLEAVNLQNIYILLLQGPSHPLYTKASHYSLQTFGKDTTLSSKEIKVCFQYRLQTFFGHTIFLKVNV